MNSPLPLAQEMFPGQSFVFQWPQAIKKMTLDTKPLSHIPQQLALGVVGHNIETTSYLIGHYELQPGHAFKAPKETLFIHAITKKLQDPDKVVKLRIPSSIVKQIENNDEDMVDRERAQMRAILAQDNGSFTTECWQRPLQSKIVSQFASQRILPNGHQYLHSGLDLRAVVGTPVLASAAGRVVFASRMAIPGNTVVIDHGGGVYSRYLHLHEFKVNANDNVERGQMIAYSGATGRVEAPHLHWEIIWKGHQADPMQFLATVDTFCEKN